MPETNGSADPTDPKSKTILIVDDDESVLNLLEIVIRHDGFKLELATSGEQAIEKLKGKPDAVVLDLNLPGEASGFDVLKHLATWKGGIPPVIVVTGLTAGRELDAVRNDPNVLLFLPKPINQDKMLQALHRVLGTKAPPPQPLQPKKPAKS